MYKYKVSVVMAVYNVELFLREAIDSVIAQDIGFDNIQLILVDDGSPDGSGAICDEYAEKYPDNIVVIHKENGGVSSARNAGIDRAEGELINFLDSDDMMTPYTFRNAYDFFCENKNKTDVVAIPMYFFDGGRGEHTLNYKFKKGNRVIDLDQEWNVCQLQSGATFINAECLQEIRFDERLSYAEDAHLLQRVLANKCSMGVMSKGKYMYRKRTTGAESAIQASRTRKNWYLDYFRYFQKGTVQFYLDKYGYVPKFVQFVLMYDIQWRLMMDHIPEGVLTDEEQEEFYSLIYGMLKYFDDEVILAQKNLYTEYKVFALRKKYGKQVLEHRANDIALNFGTVIAAKLSKCTCRMEFLKVENGECHLEGRICVYDGLQDGIQVELLVGDRVVTCINADPETYKYSLGEPILHMCSFKCNIPLDELDDTEIEIPIRVQIRKENYLIRIDKLQFGTFFPVSNQYKNGYAVQNGWKIYVIGGTVYLQKISEQESRACEKRFLKELWKRNKLGERKAVLARIFAKILMKKKRKPLWLIGDRASKAGDNGEAFFAYMCKNHPEIDARFILSKDSPDYERMSKVGPILNKDSIKHKVFSLICDYIISSQGEADVYNPFIGYSEPYRDYLSANKFIFLQHGITQNDLSNWLDRYSKNIYGFIAAARPEAQSILDFNYHYEPKNIWLTGFPRFDRLYQAEEKLITVMPTWRRYLFGECSRETKVWSIGKTFMESDYLAFFNGLLNHPQLLETAKKHGYRIAFFPHPNLQDHLDVFTKHEDVLFLGKETEYRDVYARSDLMISDYSSALFDFAYLRKPIIYAQFDKETFFSGAHTLQRGYFDYERDGFGEVEYTLEDTVQRIIEYIENDCKLKDEYRQRIDGFFAFNDKNNCQRVYDKIMELDQKG